MSESDQNVIMKLKKVRLVSTRSSRDHMFSMLLLQSFLKEQLLSNFEATKSATAYNMLKRGLRMYACTYVRMYVCMYVCM